MSRREYKKRKKALLEQLEDVEEKEPAIEFFELKDPSEFDQSNELDRRPVSIEDKPTIDILAADAAPAPDPQVSAKPTPPPPSPAAPLADPSPAAPLADQAPPVADQALHGLAPVDTSINPLALGGSPAPVQPDPAPAPMPTPQIDAASEASASAAELLARLKADQPIQSQFTSSPVGLDTDPFATATSDLVAPPPRTEEPAPAPAAAAPAQPPAQLAPAPIATEPPPARPQAEPWSPPAPPPRGSNLTMMGDTSASAPPSAPASIPVGAPARVVHEVAAPEAQVFEPETPAQSDPPSDSNSPTEDNPMRRKADTDETGQWIPPSLRGMAKPDDRDPLPKRR